MMNVIPPKTFTLLTAEITQYAPILKQLTNAPALKVSRELAAIVLVRFSENTYNKWKFKFQHAKHLILIF